MCNLWLLHWIYLFIYFHHQEHAKSNSRDKFMSTFCHSSTHKFKDFSLFISLLQYIIENKHNIIEKTSATVVGKDMVSCHLPPCWSLCHHCNFPPTFWLFLGQYVIPSLSAPLSKINFMHILNVKVYWYYIKRF